MQEPRVSIAVVVRNEAANIVRLLDSIKSLTSSAIEEVLVIDNVSEDETLKVVMDWSQSHPLIMLRIFQRKINHMAEARNLAIDSALGDWIYFTDGDCCLESKSWQRALDYLKQHQNDQKLAAFGGGNLTPLTNSLLSRGLKFLQHNWWGHMNSIQVSPPTCLQRVPLLSTCNLFLSKRWALACQGFDTDFSTVGEDLSLCHRLQLIGGELWAVPGIEVIHYQDKGLLRWWKKIFFYGQAQVLIAKRYPRHFIGIRGLQFTFVWGALLAAIFFPWLGAAVICVALGVLMNGFKNTSDSLFAKLAGSFFILVTQTVYAVGEVSASFWLVWDALLSFPRKIPSLEKR